MMVGEKLVSKNVITNDQLTFILANQKASGERFGDIAVELGYASFKDIEEALK